MIYPPTGKHYMLQRAAHRRPVRYIGSESKHIIRTCATHHLKRRGAGGAFVQIDHCHHRPLVRKTLRHRGPDPAACPHDHRHLARQFFLGRHTLQLRLLQRPVFDIEGLPAGAAPYTSRSLPHRA